MPKKVVEAEERSGVLFDEEHLRELPMPTAVLDGPTLRVVTWSGPRAGRPCLVRCDRGENNVKTIRYLVTLCGTSCAEIIGTSAREPSDKTYCNACLALAGNGVLR
jgi:hypothetical protein